jgi:hypothetical protein
VGDVGGVEAVVLGAEREVLEDAGGAGAMGKLIDIIGPPTRVRQPVQRVPVEIVCTFAAVNLDARRRPEI